MGSLGKLESRGIGAIVWKTKKGIRMLNKARPEEAANLQRDCFLFLIKKISEHFPCRFIGNPGKMTRSK